MKRGDIRKLMPMSDTPMIKRPLSRKCQETDTLFCSMIALMPTEIYALYYSPYNLRVKR